MSTDPFSGARVADLMIRDPVSVSPTTSIAEALDRMHDEKVSALPVVDDGRCVGIITVTDLLLLIRSTEKILQTDYPHFDDCLWAVELVQQKFGSDPVRNIMSEVFVRIDPAAAASDAAAMMDRESVHHLPVIGDDRQLVGFISTMDLVRHLVGRHRPTADEPA